MTEYILGHLSQQGLLCFGPREGKQPTFVLLEEWLAPAKPFVRDEAIAALAKRYFTSHGPATLQDFVWWSGLTMIEAKRGLESVKSTLSCEAIESQTYWFAEKTKTDVAPAYLLPWFDEFLVAYKDRSAALEPSLTTTVDAGGGLLNPTVVSNGQVVGIWKRSLKKDKVILNLTPFRPLEQAEKVSLEVAAEHYSTFLAKAVLLEV
jgi:hypothetical protein